MNPAHSPFFPSQLQRKTKKKSPPFQLLNNGRLISETSQFAQSAPAIQPLRPPAPLSEIAIHFFLHTYSAAGFEFADHIHPLSLPSQNGASPLSASIISVGMAGLSNTKKAPRIMIEARRQYVMALNMTNKALRDPSQARTDSTLAAVVLLGMFEVSASQRERFQVSNYHLFATHLALFS